MKLGFGRLTEGPIHPALQSCITLCVLMSILLNSKYLLLYVYQHHMFCYVVSSGV